MERDSSYVEPGLLRDFSRPVADRSIGDPEHLGIASEHPFEKQARALDKMRGTFEETRREILELRQRLLSLDARSSDFYEVTDRLATVFMSYCRLAGEMWTATAVPESVTAVRRPDGR